MSTATGNIAALGLDAAGDIFVLSNEGATKGNLGLARFLPNGTLDSIAIPKWASLS